MAASRRAGVARCGVRAAYAGAVGGRYGWRLTGFGVSVGAFALGSSADGVAVILFAMDTLAMDAGLSFEVMAIVSRKMAGSGLRAENRADGSLGWNQRTQRVEFFELARSGPAYAPPPCPPPARQPWARAPLASQTPVPSRC
eukprot:scaffold56532_cov55-Phaeocystis_antarctica.AAC.2